MKSPIYLLCLILPLFCCTRVCGQLTYARTLALTDSETHLAPHPATGGSLLIGNQNPDSLNHLAIIRLDVQGQTVSTHQVDGTTWHWPFDVELLADGSYLACGMETSPSSTWAFILSLDSGGVPQRIARTNPADQYAWVDVQAIPEDGFLMIGYAWETPQRIRKSGVAIRFDSHLDTLWTREISFVGHHTRLLTATVVPGGDLVLHGTATDTMTFVNKHFLCRMSLAGHLQWISAISAPPGQTYLGEKIVSDGAGRVYLSGNEENAQGFESHPALFAFDPAGSLLWARNVENLDYAVADVLCLRQGGGVAIGGSAGDSLGNRYSYAAAFSPSANLQWVRLYGLGTELWWSDVLAHADGGLQLTGVSSTGVQLHKTDAQGEVAGGCNSVAWPIQSNPLTPIVHTLTPIFLSGANQTFVPVASSQGTLGNTVDCLTVDNPPAQSPIHATVVPQPLRTSAHIRLPAGSMKPDTQLLLHDLHGRLCPAGLTRAGDGFELQRGSLPAGIYAYQVLQGGQQIASGKLWVAD